MNSFYQASGDPTAYASGDSDEIRTEFEAIEDAFDKFPVCAGNNGLPVRGSSDGYFLETVDVANSENTFLQPQTFSIVCHNEYNNGNSGASITISLENGNYQSVTINEDAVINISYTNAPAGKYQIRLINEGFSVTYDGMCNWVNGKKSYGSTEQGSESIINVYYDGSSKSFELLGIGYNPETENQTVCLTWDINNGPVYVDGTSAIGEVVVPDEVSWHYSGGIYGIEGDYPASPVCVALDGATSLWFASILPSIDYPGHIQMLVVYPNGTYTEVSSVPSDLIYACC